MFPRPPRPPRFPRPLLPTALALALAPGALAQPQNDSCPSAIPVPLGGFVIGTASGATSDGASSCSPTGLSVPDVYHSFRADQGGLYTFSLCSGTNWDTVLSVHSFCPATITNQIECDDEACRPSGATTFGFPSSLTTYLAPQTSYILRISGYDLGSGFDVYRLTASGPTIPTGACCIGTVCSIATSAECGLAGGSFAGNLSACLAPALEPVTRIDSGLPVVIPDNLLQGVTRTLTFPPGGQVASVRLSLSINHTWAGDVAITLSHAGRTATVLQRLRGGLFGTYTDLFGTYEFADSATASLWSIPVVVANDNPVALIPQGSYFATDNVGGPVSLSQVFEGVDVEGDWTLKVTDSGPGDIGSLTGFELVVDRSLGNLCTTSPPTAGACCTGSVPGGLGNQCAVITPAACALASGNFRGTSTVCGTATTNPTTCCKANFNALGGVSVQDVFDFLTAWFNSLPEANFNSTGGITVQDIFDFLTAWFAGCGVQ